MNVRQRVHNRPILVTILSQINPFHSLTFRCLKTNFNIIFPSRPRPSKCFFPLGFPTKTLYEFLLFLRVPHFQPISFFLDFYYPDKIGLGERITKLLIMQSPPITCSLFSPLPCVLVLSNDDMGTKDAVQK